MSSRRPCEPDRLAELVRLGGTRRVPTDVARRMRGAIIDHWRVEMQRRERHRNRRRRIVFVGLAASFLVIALGLGAWRRSIRTLSLPAVQAIIGRATLNAGAARFVAVGTTLPIGSELTSDQDSLVAILWPDGHSVRLGGGTRVRILRGPVIALELGAMYVDSGFESLARHDPLAVDTPAGRVVEIGTQFELRVADYTRIAVREGKVQLVGESHRENVAAGTRLDIAADGTMTRQEISRYGSEWDWFAAVTPVLELEGRTLQEFLDWIAREKGMTLAFADPAISERASTIILTGSIESLTVDQALDAVLPTCQLSHTVEQGTLTILEEESGIPDGAREPDSEIVGSVGSGPAVPLAAAASADARSTTRPDVRGT